MGDDITDTDCSLEALRRPRSEAQIAAFEKDMAKRAANRAAAAPATPFRAEGACAASAASYCAEGACAAPAAPAAPAHALAAKHRKARTDKGKKRGHLVRPGTANASQEYSEEE